MSYSREHSKYLRYLNPHIVHMAIAGKGVIKNNTQVLKGVRTLNRLVI